MGGRIFDTARLSLGEPQQTATLAEVREVWVPLANMAAVVRAAGSPPALAHAAVDACKAVADQWLDAHGLDSEVTPFSDDGRVGVRFSVIIGRQDSADGSRDDQGGVPWRWSARWTHWADKLTAMRRLAYTPVSDDQATVIDFGAALAMREHQAHADHTHLPVGPR